MPVLLVPKAGGVVVWQQLGLIGLIGNRVGGSHIVNACYGFHYQAQTGTYLTTSW
jgi:hypothetical protein